MPSLHHRLLEPAVSSLACVVRVRVEVAPFEVDFWQESKECLKVFVYFGRGSFTEAALSVGSVNCFVSWARSSLNFACSSGVNLLSSASVSKVSRGSLLGADASACSHLQSFDSSSIAESRMRLWTLG